MRIGFMISIAIAGCKGSTPTDRSDAPTLPEWPVTAVEGDFAGSLMSCLGSSVLLVEDVPTFTLPVTWLDLETGMQAFLGSAPSPASFIGLNNTVVARRTELFWREDDGWSSLAGMVAIKGDHGWVSGTELQHFDIPTHSIITLGAAPLVNAVLPVGDGSTVVLQPRTDELIWADLDGMIELGPAPASVFTGDQVIYADEQGDLYRAAATPESIGRVLTGQLVALEDGSVLAETGPFQVERWNGTWHLVSDTHRIEHAHPSGAVLITDAGVPAVWGLNQALSPTETTALQVQPIRNRQFQSVAWRLTRDEGDQLLTTEGTVVPLPPDVVEYLVDDRLLFPRTTSGLPQLINHTTGQVFEGTEPMGQFCQGGSYGEQVLYHAPSGDLWRLNEQGTTHIGLMPCDAYALGDGSTWALVDGIGQRIGPDGTIETLGSFHDLHAANGVIVASRTVATGATFDQLGEVGVTLFRIEDGSEIVRTNAGASLSGTPYDVVPVLEDHVAVWGSGCPGCATSTVSLSIFDDAGVKVLSIPNATSVGLRRAGCPHVLATRRVQDQSFTEIYSLP